MVTLGESAIIFNVDVRTLDANKALNKLMVSVKMLGAAIDKVNQSFRSLTQRQLEGHSKTLAMLNKQGSAHQLLDQANANAVKGMFKSQNALKGVGRQVSFNRKHMLGMGLSALFAGMALRRLGMAVATSLVNNFTQIADNSHQGMQAVNGVNAAFSFMKFAIFDALSQTGLFSAFTEFLINAATWIGEFIAQHPGLAAMIGVLIGAAIVIGTIAMFGGQLATVHAAFGGMIKLDWGKLVTNLKSVGSAIWGVFLKALPFIAVFAIAGVAVLALEKILDSDLDPTLKLVLMSLTGIAAVIAGGAAAKGLGLNAAFGVWAVAIGIVIWAFTKLRDKLGSTQAAIGGFILFILRAFAAVIDFALMPFLGAWNAIASVIPGLKQLDDINVFTGGGLIGNKIDEIRDSMLEDARILREEREAEAERARVNAMNPYTGFGGGPGVPTESGVAPKIELGDESITKLVQEMVGSGYVLPSTLQ